MRLADVFLRCPTRSTGIPTLVEVYDKIQEMGWDTDLEVKIGPNESVADFLKRCGVKPGQLKVERTPELYHVTLFHAEQGGKYGSNSKLWGAEVGSTRRFEPRQPSSIKGANFSVPSGEEDVDKITEDTVTERVCFSKTLEGALKGVPSYGPTDWVFVYKPVSAVEVVHPAVDPLPQFKGGKTVDEKNRFRVSDVGQSGEVWALRPVTVKLVEKVPPKEQHVDRWNPFSEESELPSDEEADELRAWLKRSPDAADFYIDAVKDFLKRKETGKVDAGESFYSWYSSKNILALYFADVKSKKVKKSVQLDDWFTSQGGWAGVMKRLERE